MGSSMPTRTFCPNACTTLGVAGGARRLNCPWSLKMSVAVTAMRKSMPPEKTLRRTGSQARLAAWAHGAGVNHHPEHVHARGGLLRAVHADVWRKRWAQLRAGKTASAPSQTTVVAPHLPLL